MYFVSMLTKLKKGKLGWWNVGSQHTVGYFETLVEAQEIVTNNSFDLCETVYEYTLIEGIPSGGYPSPSIVEMYRTFNMTVVEDGCKVYNPNLTYERIKHPKDFEYTTLAIG